MVQRLILRLVVGDLAIFIAILFGTAAGLVMKFELDRRYIFAPTDKPTTKLFSGYMFTGIGTTALFWGSELIFFYWFKSEFAREVGAILGLGAGYLIKYRLDKRYVFHTQNLVGK
tara:strand:- start:586 stop:930 length:345 start_codon:yes stop_codon:yes gene_type:complete